MGGDLVVPEAFREVESQALAQTSGIHEDEGGALAGNQLRQPAVDLFPGVERADRLQWVARQLNLQLHGAAISLVYDGAGSLSLWETPS